MESKSNTAVPQVLPNEDTRDVVRVSPRFAIAAMAIFLSVLILPMLFWGILKLIPGGTDAFEVELSENRAPFKMPEKINVKTLTADLESYFNDRIPFRSLLLSVHKDTTNAVELPYKESIRPFMIQVFFSGSSGSTPTPPTTIPGPGFIYGDDTGEQPTDEPGTDEPADPTLPPTEVLVAGDPNCNHTFNEGETVQEASCAEDGWGKLCRTCSACNRQVLEYQPRTEHQMSLADHLDPTCFSPGYDRYQCTVCNHVKETVLAGGHAKVEEETVEPSYKDYGYTLMRCTRCMGEFRTNLQDKKYDNTPFPLTIAGPQEAGAIEGKHKWLFYSGNNSIGFYQNTNPLNDKQLQNYAAVLQELYDLCQAQGKEVRIMFMPNKEQIYWEYMPTLDVIPGDKRTQKFADYIEANTDMDVVFPYEELLAAKPYWQVYSRLDTHWNAAGGFIGAQALYKSLGMETTSLYDLTVIRDNSRTLSNSDLINIGSLDADYYGEDVDYIITYRPEINMLSEKGGFETSDISITESDSENECRFVMLSDSFRKNMVPFLKKDFSNGLFTHRSHVNDPSVQQGIKEADIIVIAAVERGDTGVINTAKEVIKILKENQ